MNSTTESGRGRSWFLGRGMLPKVSAVAALAILLVVALAWRGGAIPWTTAAGASQSPSAEESLPPPPSAPAGWHSMMAFSGGTSGFDPGESRIAVHVLCKGPGDLIVMANTRRNAYGQPSQATLFNCLGTGWQEGRVEFSAAPGQLFVEVYATSIPIAGDNVPTLFWVSVEVPDATS